MTVYIDVLIILNTLVTYFMLLAVRYLTKANDNILRLVSASFFGGFTSICIFLPKLNVFIEFIIKIFICCLISLIAFKIHNIKSYIRATSTLLFITIGFTGFMIAFFYILKPRGMVINNGVIYFSISPIIIIVSAALCYALMRLYLAFFKREDSNSRAVDIQIIYKKTITLCRCIVDSGCSINDTFGDRRVAIIGKKTAEKIFDIEVIENALKLNVTEIYPDGFTLIPFKTLNFNGVMPAFLVDSITVNNVHHNRALVCITDTCFDGDFDGIVPPDFLY